MTFNAPCTVLRESVALGRRHARKPGTAGLYREAGKQEGQLILLCAIFYFPPTAITDRETPCEKAASSRGVPLVYLQREGRMPNRAFCAVLPCSRDGVCVATCVSNLALTGMCPGSTNLVFPLK